MHHRFEALSFSLVPSVLSLSLTESPDLLTPHHISPVLSGQLRIHLFASKYLLSRKTLLLREESGKGASSFLCHVFIF